ncbi:hypothetical protein M758_UG110600 [Ceratodon purpureus]|nr:hypothetical protein M758_UG110600 [Ceratodon purpureus]
MLETPEGSDNESSNSMVWSPERFGRYLGVKRHTSIASPIKKKPASRAQPSSSSSSEPWQSKQKVMAESSGSQPAGLNSRGKESPTKFRILYDKSPVEAFRLLEEEGLLNSSYAPNQASKAGSSQESQRCSSVPSIPYPAKCSAPQAPSPEQALSRSAADSGKPSPSASLAMVHPADSDFLEQQLQQRPPRLNSSSSPTKDKIKSLGVAAAYKAKWLELNRRLDAASVGG